MKKTWEEFSRMKMHDNFYGWHARRLWEAPSNA
jgi:hypothetical protein